MPRKKGYKSKYPYLGPMGRIRALAAYQEQQMKRTGEPPVWTAACYRMGVNLRTVLLRAPELAAKWYDKDFHLHLNIFGHVNVGDRYGKISSKTGIQSTDNTTDQRTGGIPRPQSRRMGRPPSWTSSCKKIGINYRTVRRYAPELMENWDDKTFRW